MIKNFIITGLGTFLSQILIFAALPFITSIWGIESVGDYSFSISLGVIVSTLLVLKLDLVIMNDSEYDARRYLLTVSCLALILSLILSLFCFIFGVIQFLPAICYGFVLLIFNSICLYLSVIRNYITITIYRIFFNCIFIALAINFPNKFSLITFHSIAVFSIVIVFCYKERNSMFDMQLIDFQSLWLRGRNFIFKSLPASSLNILTNNSLFLLIPFIFGIKEAGVFFIVYKTLIFPVGIVGQSLGNILRREILCAIQNNQNVISIIKRTLLLLIFVVILYLISIHTFYEVLILYFFADISTEIYEIYQLLIPLAISMIIFGPLGHIFFCLDLQRFDLIFNLIKSLIVFITLSVAIFIKVDFIHFIELFSISMATAYLIGLLMISYCVKYHSSNN